MKTGYGPDGIPYATARKNRDGTIHLRHPSPDTQRERLSSFQDYPLVIRHWRNTDSLLVHWLGRKIGLKTLWRMSPFHTRAEELVRRPGYESTLDGWDPADIADISMSNFLTQPDPPPVFQEALEFTAFALDEFRRWTKRDGAELVILASHTMGRSGDPLFERMADMARERGIPVINQSDYIARQGGKIEDARFAHDDHWSAQGPPVGGGGAPWLAAREPAGLRRRRRCVSTGARGQPIGGGGVSGSASPLLERRFRRLRATLGSDFAGRTEPGEIRETG